MIRPGRGRDAISAVKMSKRLTAEVDACAKARDMVRSDTIRYLNAPGASSLFL
jgi:hypothetical protein